MVVAFVVFGGGGGGVGVGCSCCCKQHCRPATTTPLSHSAARRGHTLAPSPPPWPSHQQLCSFFFVSPFFFIGIKTKQVVFFSDGSEGPTVSHPRLVVKAGEDSHVKFTQGYLSQGGVCLANGYTRVLVGDRANVVSRRESRSKRGAGLGLGRRGVVGGW